ncbi:hypothetical protein NL676_032691 [Syzygium grande]|nr:hypothetical protein NL676_032691 [Syzygium grande]
MPRAMETSLLTKAGPCCCTRPRPTRHGQARAALNFTADMTMHEADAKYPDLRHSLFDEEEDDVDLGGSVIDLVKNAKEEGDEFCLEDEVDHVADLFIGGSTSRYGCRSWSRSSGSKRCPGEAFEGGRRKNRITCRLVERRGGARFNYIFA